MSAMRAQLSFKFFYFFIFYIMCFGRFYLKKKKVLQTIKIKLMYHDSLLIIFLVGFSLAFSLSLSLFQPMLVTLWVTHQTSQTLLEVRQLF